MFKGFILLCFLFFALLFFTLSASAANEVVHKLENGKVQHFSTYEAKSMKRNQKNEWMFVTMRGCKFMNAKQVIARENLAPNPEITGGVYCGGNYNRTTILIRDITRVKDGVLN